MPPPENASPTRLRSCARSSTSSRVLSLGSFPSPKLIEVAGKIANVHGLWIDQEHSAVSHAQLELMLMACRAAGLTPFVPQGAYYMLVDFTRLGYADDREAAAIMLEKEGVAVIPGSSFYADPRDGRMQVRLCYAKKMPDLEEACRRIRNMKAMSV